MLLEIFGFLQLTLPDILDILMVTTILCVLFKWIRGSSAMNIFGGIIFLLLLWLIVEALNMKLMSSLLKAVFDVGVLAILIIFQPEIRRFLTRLGGNKGISGKAKKIINKFFGNSETGVDDDSVKEIAEACRAMSNSYTGALIVIPGRDTLQSIVETGDRIDAIVSRRLIRNIFFKNSPLHDGAMIIQGKRIVAARCTLPITNRSDIPPQLGMRHKAAIGISEESDASVIVVSEETGSVSFVRSGIVKPIETMYELSVLLNADKYKDDNKEDADKQKIGGEAGLR